MSNKHHPWRSKRAPPLIEGPALDGIYRINDKIVTREEYETWRKESKDKQLFSTANLLSKQKKKNERTKK
jgi:hypothetical protein